MNNGSLQHNAAYVPCLACPLSTPHALLFSGSNTHTHPVRCCFGAIEEWGRLGRLLHGSSGAGLPAAAAAVGAVVAAPLLEEGLFRGYILPSLTKWMHPGTAVSMPCSLPRCCTVCVCLCMALFRPCVSCWGSEDAALPARRAQVLVSSALFAAAHPAADALPEFTLGCLFGSMLLAAEGNLAVPILCHGLYNGLVLGSEFLLAS